jgi:hypothetical protein
VRARSLSVHVVAAIAAMTALAGAPACSPHADVPVSDAGPDILPDPPDGAPVEWTGWAGDFVRDYCVQCHNPAAPCSGSNCHPGAGPLFDFRLHDTVVSMAPQMRCGVATTQDPAWGCDAVAAKPITPKQFPVDMGGNPMPTDHQRDLFVQWVDAGCP